MLGENQMTEVMFTCHRECSELVYNDSIDIEVVLIRKICQFLIPQNLDKIRVHIFATFC